MGSPACLWATGEKEEEVFELQPRTTKGGGVRVLAPRAIASAVAAAVVRMALEITVTNTSKSNGFLGCTAVAFV